MITVTHNGTHHELDPQTIGAIIELIAGDLDLPQSEDEHAFTVEFPQQMEVSAYQTPDGIELNGFSPASQENSSAPA